MYLVDDESEQATSYAKKAFGLSPDSEDIRFIWGILLVENQHWHDGGYLLKPLFDSDYPNTRTVLVAAYLALVYHHQHQEKKKARFLSFAQRHLDQLDHQDMYLYEGVLCMLNESPAPLPVLDITNR